MKVLYVCAVLECNLLLYFCFQI